MRTSLFSLVALLMVSHSHAMGGKYSDPGSQISSFFTDVARRDRLAFDSIGTPSSQQLQAQWEKTREILPKDRAAWDLWFALNIEAAQIWETLAELNDHDWERTRIAYYQGRMEKERLTLLHGRFKDFIGTTQIGYFDSFMEDTRVRIPWHPLLGQIALEYASTIVRFYNISKDPWEWRYSRAFGDRVNKLLAKKNEGAVGAEYAHARAYLNTHLILAMMPRSELAEELRWGIWGDASRMLSQLISKQWLISYSPWRNLMQRRDDAFFIPLSVGTGLTDDSALSEKQISSTLLEEPASVIVEFRGLAEKYGFATYRYRNCGSFLKTPDCNSKDPSNPNEAYDAL